MATQDDPRPALLASAITKEIVGTWVTQDDPRPTQLSHSRTATPNVPVKRVVRATPDAEACTLTW